MFDAAVLVRPLPAGSFPPRGAFATCAEEDSNLHPVIPDQALNLVRWVSDASRACPSVHCVQGSGRYGRIRRSGSCHACCHGSRPSRRMDHSSAHRRLVPVHATTSAGTPGASWQVVRFSDAPPRAGLPSSRYAAVAVGVPPQVLAAEHDAPARDRDGGNADLPALAQSVLLSNDAVDAPPAKAPTVAAEPVVDTPGQSVRAPERR
jgi:hypothetical protein